jgi:hypothetical protein
VALADSDRQLLSTAGCKLCIQLFEQCGLKQTVAGTGETNSNDDDNNNNNNT